MLAAALFGAMMPQIATSATLLREGEAFSATYNVHGIVLAPADERNLSRGERQARTIYLGVGCDVLNANQDRGRWRWSGQYVFVEYLDGRTERYVGRIEGDLAERCAL
ncbi:hypothetical protein FHS89_002444 [Rubricella aquisinus]|uniref:Uncharacterized protein n=1 Tax=Rubricella aquisinus TaxID=2028108 RepID=A0A840WQU1_9RHOB|nr:hypothetical protein [Rubricella aquisinus]MBB5516413.1 hypothetical protein [Rubricella aquisinus]